MCIFYHYNTRTWHRRTSSTHAFKCYEATNLPNSRAFAPHSKHLYYTEHTRDMRVQHIASETHPLARRHKHACRKHMPPRTNRQTNVCNAIRAQTLDFPLTSYNIRLPTPKSAAQHSNRSASALSGRRSAGAWARTRPLWWRGGVALT